MKSYQGSTRTWIIGNEKVLEMIKKLQISILTALVVILVTACGTSTEAPINMPTQAEEEKVSQMTQAGYDPSYIGKEGVDVI